MSAEAELDGFIQKFAPDMQGRIRACRANMTARFPRAVQLVYDNYNFLVIGYGPSERASDAIFSLAADRNRVNLCFLQRATARPDPAGLLRGSGKIVRTVRLAEPGDLARPELEALVSAALALARLPMDATDGPKLIIKSVSAKQRSRR